MKIASSHGVYPVNACYQLHIKVHNMSDSNFLDYRDKVDLYNRYQGTSIGEVEFFKFYTPPYIYGTVSICCIIMSHPSRLCKLELIMTGRNGPTLQSRQLLINS